MQRLGQRQRRTKLHLGRPALQCEQGKRLAPGGRKPARGFDQYGRQLKDGEAVLLRVDAWHRALLRQGSLEPEIQAQREPEQNTSHTTSRSDDGWDVRPSEWA